MFQFPVLLNTFLINIYIYLLSYSGSVNIFLEQVGNVEIQGTGSIELKMAKNQTLIPIVSQPLIDIDQQWAFVYPAALDGAPQHLFNL